jgi:hypothetical protein
MGCCIKKHCGSAESVAILRAHCHPLDFYSGRQTVASKPRQFQKALTDNNEDHCELCRLNEDAALTFKTNAAYCSSKRFLFVCPLFEIEFAFLVVFQVTLLYF